MNNHMITGFWRFMLKVPPALWEKEIEKHRRRVLSDSAFMTPEHRRVHHFAVSSLPGRSQPLAPEEIASALGIEKEDVLKILNDLEQHKTFLFRNKSGAVTWAYPMTVEKTPHHLTFDDGRTCHAAWAVDAFAAPFVQGRIEKRKLSVTVRSSCAHSSEPMEIKIDSDLKTTVHGNGGTRPMVFVPKVNVQTLKEPSIIESFWKQSVFFRSEEHARAYRKSSHRIRGGYLKVEQVSFITRAMQSALFGFDPNSGF